MACNVETVSWWCTRQAVAATARIQTYGHVWLVPRLARCYRVAPPQQGHITGIIYFVCRFQFEGIEILRFNFIS
jgi:hypothetical protein